MYLVTVRRLMQAALAAEWGEAAAAGEELAEAAMQLTEAQRAFCAEQRSRMADTLAAEKWQGKESERQLVVAASRWVYGGGAEVAGPLIDLCKKLVAVQQLHKAAWENLGWDLARKVIRTIPTVDATREDLHKALHLAHQR